MTRRLLGSLLLAGVVSACLSPTLPLPPPARPEVQGPDAAGNVRLTGRVPGGARVSAHNPRTNLISGQQTDESGAYDFVIAAEAGDELFFWYSRGTAQSPGISILIQEPQSQDDSTGMGGAAAD